MILAERSNLQHVSVYVTEFRSLVGYYTGWADIDFRLGVNGNELEVFDILNNDDCIFQSLSLLSLWSAGEYFTIEVPRFPDLQKVLNRSISYIKDFTHARKSLIQFGSLFGMGVQRKTFMENVVWDDFPGMKWTVPIDVREVDRRRLRLERDHKERQCTFWSIWSEKYDQYLLIKDRLDNPGYEDGFALQDYIFYIHEYEETSPFGKGFGQILFPLAYIRKFTREYWGDLAESWSKPFLLFFVNSAKAAINASLGEGFTQARTRVNDLLKVVENSRARHQMVLDKGDELKVLEFGNKSKNIIEDLLLYCDDRIHGTILGSQLTTGTGKASSYALGQIHKGSTNTIVQYHRNRLENALERELVWDLIRRNWENVRKILGGKSIYPNDITCRISTNAEDKKEKILEGADGAGAAKLAITM